ncbi:IS200/IS605 family element transposase accessory protein TnpB [Streptomyces sannanensis]|uniref:IS200/IS605 family element transposase accessory protein TnpB n=1 Tax=Streptomyces sannanensis TaxID=285536 RepID=A0ABP6SHK9_9ACTN
MAGKQGKKRELRTIAAPFTVAAPAGARIRDRLCITPGEAEVLRLAGEHLGRHQRADLAARVRIGEVRKKDTRRAERKKTLTAVSSSRWAGAMTRADEDQYQLSLRCLYDERTCLRRAVRTITRRLAVPCGKRVGTTRGYPTQGERFQKQRRLQVLQARLAGVEARIASGRPAIVVGGRRLLKTRHNLAAAQLTEQQWRQRWEAGRLFLTADGESGAPYGNYTITVAPENGSVTLVLPEPLRHLANAPRGRYTLSCSVTFHHVREEWLDRVTAHRAVRYDIVYEPGRGRWYVDASWSADKAVLPSPEEIRAFGEKLLGVDLNADHLAAYVLDPHGNPVGEPITVPIDLTGSTIQRDGRLRNAISELIRIAREHECAGIAIEDLGFYDARQVGRETMGRGGRGKRFRRTVAGIPTAKFRERLRSMAFHQGLVVIAVDPAYTSVWGERYWRTPLQQQTNSKVTRHHGASVAIARRALGHRIRRRPGVTAHDQRIVARRATGQAVFIPRMRGTASPPRTASTPNTGGNTRLRQGDQLALFPDPEDRSRGHRTSPVSCDSANSGQHR